MSHYEQASQATVSVPTLIVCGVLLFFTVGYFYKSSSASTSSSAYPSASGARQRRPVPWDEIETIITMFPQVQARDVEYDLLRNGGSVQATSETVLRQGSLSSAPSNFRAQTPPNAVSSTTSTSSRGSPQQPQSKYADLITRYNLSSKVAKGKGKEVSASSNSDDSRIQTAEAQRQKGGWSSSKTERQDLLKRRREEMVLQARRRMEEKGSAP
ncbi:MAG: hypothetical protein M1828_006247 [Chrysothrix sp. TS-e1954]|nr:MAG: hypothetical protein M1828_006247 [Chrysothrix sp. TS-e1954]